MGVASFPDNAGDPEAIVAAADEALYGSKRAGRDRVTISHRKANAVGPEAKRQSAAGAA